MYLIINLSFQNAFAEAGQLSTTDRKVIEQQLDYEVKFTSLMLKLGDEIHSDLEKLGLETRSNHPNFLIGNGVNDILINKITQYSIFFEQQTKMQEIDASKFRLEILKVRLSQLKATIRDSVVGLGPLIKRKGRGVITGLIFGTILEFVTFGALYSTGLTSIIPYAMIIPFRPLGIVLVTAREQITERIRLSNLLGGRASLRAYKQQRKVTLRRLKMTTADQLILPLTTPLNRGASELESIVLSQNSWWHKFLTLFNIQPSSLSFSSIKLFVNMNNIRDIYIEDLIHNSTLPDYLRTLLIVEHLINTKNEETVILFMTKFSKNFVKVKALPEWEAAKAWTHLLMQAKDVPTIRSLMADPPPGIGASQILTIWDELVLPHYSHSYTMSYHEYRALKKEVTLLRSLSDANRNNRWSEDFAKLFDEKFIMALNHHLPVCKNPEARALQFLLKSR